MDQDNSLKPRLPPEIEREIFEIAIGPEWDDDVDVDHRYRTFFSFLTIAKRISKWIESAMYSAMVISKHLIFNGKIARGGSPFLPHFLSLGKEMQIRNGRCSPTNQDLEDPALRQPALVKSILVRSGPQHPPDVVAMLLKMCPNVTKMALWNQQSEFFDEDVSQTISTISLTDLSIFSQIESPSLSKCFNNTPLSCSISRLEFWSFSACDTGSAYHWLTSLPHMTHLCIGGSNIAPTVDAILKESKTLVQLIVFQLQDPFFPRDHINTWEQRRLDQFRQNDYGVPACVDDPRVIFVRDTHICHTAKNWEAGVRGEASGSNVWNLGDKAQLKRLEASALIRS